MRAMLGSLRAMMRGALSLLGGAHDDLHAADRAFGVVVKPRVLVRHREIARGGRVVACRGGDVTGVRCCVSLAGDLQSHAGGLLALAGRTLADIAAELMGFRVDAVGKVTIACGLIAIRRVLIGIGQRLVVLAAGVVGVGQRLVGVGEGLLAIGEGLLAVDEPAACSGIAGLILSAERPVFMLHGRIA